MLKTLTFIRHNAIALLALFVALGGTSYAALALPAGSVGARQLRNHSITPIKLDPGSIGGYVRFWARVSAGGAPAWAEGSVFSKSWSIAP